MKYTLRKYQQEASDAGLKFLTTVKNRNSVVVIPTGGGKSLIIADIVSRLDGATIIFQPSKELLEQNYAKYISYGNYASIFSASKNQKKISKVTYATIGSVIKHSHLFRDFKYCIIDECHLVNPNSETMYQKFFNETGLNNLGFTATPIRLKSYSGFKGNYSQLNMLNRQIPKSYHNFCYVTQVSDLAADGYFSPIIYRVNKMFRKDALKPNSTGAEFSDSSMKRAMNLSDVNGLTVRFINQTSQKHILVFMKTIDDAKVVVEKTGCSIVTSETKAKDREDILNRFKSGEIKCVVNVGVLTTGFDFPELDTIVLSRPTLSLALYYQMIGRGVRPHASKEACVVLDIVNNYERFGRVEDLEIKEAFNGWGIFSRGKLLTGVPMYS